MTTPGDRAAAERLRRFAATDRHSPGPCPVYGLQGDRLCDAIAADRRVLADAYPALASSVSALEAGRDRLLVALDDVLGAAAENPAVLEAISSVWGAYSTTDIIAARVRLTGATNATS